MRNKKKEWITVMILVMYSWIVIPVFLFFMTKGVFLAAKNISKMMVQKILNKAA